MLLGETTRSPSRAVTLIVSNVFETLKLTLSVVTLPPDVVMLIVML